MQRKTALEVLSTGNPAEIRSWLRTATLDELRDALEAVKRHDTWGSHWCGTLSTYSLQLIASERPNAFFFLLTWRRAAG